MAPRMRGRKGLLPAPKTTCKLCKQPAIHGDTLCKSHRFFADHGKSHAKKPEGAA